MNSLKKLVAVAVALTIGVYGVGLAVSAQAGGGDVVPCVKAQDGQVLDAKDSASAAVVTKTKTLKTPDMTIEYQKQNANGSCGDAPALLEFNTDNKGAEPPEE